MAQVNEDEQQRETLGPVSPAPEEPIDAIVDSSPTDAEAAPSAEETTDTQESEQATPPTSQPEKKWNQPPPERWEQLRRQAEDAKRQAQEYQRLAELALQRGQQPQAPATPQADPWEPLVNHQDPATAQYYRQMQSLIQHERRLAKQEAIQELSPVINAGREELARLNIREFRKDNPEIKPGSEEEAQIVAYMNGQVDGTRHSIESAKRNALFDRLEAENRALKSKQAASPKKLAANASQPSTGMPQTAGVPRKQGDWRDKAGEILDKGGSFKDVADTIFG